MARSANVIRLIPDWVVTVGVLGAFLVIWTSVTQAGGVGALFLPGPGATWAAFVDLVTNGYNGIPLWQHAEASFVRIGLGFGTGATVGVFLGLTMGLSRPVEQFFSPLIEFLRPLPQLSYMILLIVWLGIGESAQVMCLFLAALPVAVIASRDGVRSTSLQRVQAAESLGASRFQVFRHVVVPSALPDIFAGLRLSIGVVYTTLIAAELIAGTNGLGFIVLEAGRNLQTGYVFVGIFFLGVAGVGLDFLARFAETRIVHWAGRG